MELRVARPRRLTGFFEVEEDVPAYSGAGRPSNVRGPVYSASVVVAVAAPVEEGPCSFSSRSP